MLDSIRKSLLAALRAVPLTADEVEAVIVAFERRGEISGELGGKLREALLGGAGRAGSGTEARPEGDFSRLVEHFPLVSRREFRELAERVRLLEERQGTARPPASPSPPPEEPGPSDVPEEVPPPTPEGE